MPEWLDWDLWLGPAAERPFHPQWLQWHAWRDFATGTLGNWGPHSGNLPFMAFKVASLWYADAANPPPLIRLSVELSEIERLGFPRWESFRYEVPARGELPPIAINIHNGAAKTTKAARRRAKRIEELIGRQLDWGDAGERHWKEHGGCLVVGTEGMIQSTEHNSSFVLLPEKKFADFKGPPQTLPRSGSHEREWLRGLQGRAAGHVELRLRRAADRVPDAGQRGHRSSASRWSTTRSR